MACLPRDLRGSCPVQFKVFPTANTPNPMDQLIIKSLMRRESHVDGRENPDYAGQGVLRTGGKKSCSVV